MSETVRIRLENLVAMIARNEVVLVAGSRAESWDEPLPDTGRAPRTERVLARCPIVEVAHHGDALGIRCPDREVDSFLAIQHAGMSAHFLVGTEPCPFAEQVDIVLRQQRAIMARRAY
jgi:hypothetical protein